ncbi:hypothetical protein Glove_114g190 [Diversispora epigaea]|uniref:Reverse transcriptase zinc-binding domain-containing protein n=1 Tax=Diversispora epigaea TaxID=1348612 RepID=A0A397J539_9GLOM|nr:hypothetical protein Glove_114g190 [Diversispora epigaea]
MWNSSLLEISIKEAAKEIHRVKTMIDWKFQERFKHFMNSDKNKKVDWDLTFKTKHPSKITSDYTNNTDMHKRSFAMKLLCEELPTMTKRHLHQPNLYEDSECIFCSHAEEDNLHVFTCKRGGEEDPIRELCVKFKNRLNMVTCLNYCGEVDYHSTKHGPYLTFFEIIKGFVPDLFTYKVTEICKDKRMAVRVIMETFEDFQNVLKEIWKDRCEKVITWEIENGITNKAKRKKRTVTNSTKEEQNRDGLHIMGGKSDEEKEYLKEKQRQKQKNIDYFIDDIFLKIPRLRNLGNDGPDDELSGNCHLCTRMKDEECYARMKNTVRG